VRTAGSWSRDHGGAHVDVGARERTLRAILSAAAAAPLQCRTHVARTQRRQGGKGGGGGGAGGGGAAAAREGHTYNSQLVSHLRRRSSKLALMCTTSCRRGEPQEECPPCRFGYNRAHLLPPPLLPPLRRRPRPGSRPLLRTCRRLTHGAADTASVAACHRGEQAAGHGGTLGGCVEEKGLYRRRDPHTPAPWQLCRQTRARPSATQCVSFRWCRRSRHAASKVKGSGSDGRASRGEHVRVATPRPPAATSGSKDQ